MKRFDKLILREEYFGGFLYRFDDRRYTVIEQSVWKLLKNSNTSDGAKQFGLLCETDSNVENIANILKQHHAMRDDYRLVFPVHQQEYPLRQGILSAPFRCYLHTNFNCNLNCVHCATSGNNIAPMTKEQIFSVFDILYEHQIPELIITGGEPFIRKDIIQIIDRAKEMGFVIKVNSNGVVSKAYLDCLERNGVDELVFSLDGNPEFHDKARGKGSFEHLLKSVKYITSIRQNIKDIVVNFCFRRDNIHQLEDVIKVCEAYNLNLNLLPLRPQGKAVNMTEQLLDAEEFMEFTQKVNRLQKESKISIKHNNFDLFNEHFPDFSNNPVPFNRASCGAAQQVLALTPDGKPIGCGFMPVGGYTSPNILETSFENVWFCDYLNYVREIKIPKQCLTCKFHNERCQGACKAMLVLPNGSVNGNDRYCFKHLIEETHESRKLKRINLEVTRNCNMNCRLCYNKSDMNLKNELTTHEIKCLIDEAAKMNVAEIRFTGGEALTRPDIFQLIDYTIDRKRFYISLSTNGVMDDGVFDELVKREINDVIVSIDGTEKTHNFQRPAKKNINSYQSAVSFIDRLKEFSCGNKFKVIRTNTVLTKITATEEVVRHLIELCRDKKLELVSFIYPQPSGRATRQTEHFLTNEEVYQFNLTVRKLRQEYTEKGYSPKIIMDYDVLGTEEIPKHPVVPRIKSCPAGRDFVFISPEGNVYPCGAVSFEGDNPFLAGNIRENTLESIWTKSACWHSFRNLSKSKSQKCFSCKFWGKTCFGSCPVTSWLLHRTLNGADPYCYTEFLGHADDADYMDLRRL